MVRKALKWMFFLWLLSLGAAYAEDLVTSWSAGRPSQAERRTAEVAEQLEAGELTAAELEAALEEVAELQRAESSREAGAESVGEATSPASETQAPRRGPSADEVLRSALSGWFRQVQEMPSEKNTTAADASASQAKAENAIAVLDGLYREWIAVLEAIAEAHTDEWEKRWAQDAVSMAQFDRRHQIGNHRANMAGTSMLPSPLQPNPYSEWLKYEGVQTGAGAIAYSVRWSIQEAQETLAALQAESSTSAQLAAP